MIIPRFGDLHADDPFFTQEDHATFTSSKVTSSRYDKERQKIRDKFCNYSAYITTTGGGLLQKHTAYSGINLIAGPSRLNLRPLGGKIPLPVVETNHSNTICMPE